jgi:hypothetical protein
MMDLLVPKTFGKTISSSLLRGTLLYRVSGLWACNILYVSLWAELVMQIIFACFMCYLNASLL